MQNLPPLPQPPLPLAVDLDGTLHLQDTTWEACKWALCHTPWLALRALARWRPSTRAPLKALLATATEPANWLPHVTWDVRIIALMAAAKAEGREVIIVTGTWQATAQRLTESHGLPYPVLGTTSPTTNLIAAEKAKLLVARYGERGFDYAGNSHADLAVWPHARSSIVVNATPNVQAAARALGNVAFVLPPENK